MRVAAFGMCAAALLSVACGASFESGAGTSAAGGASTGAPHAGGSNGGAGGGAGGGASGTSTTTSSHGGSGGQGAGPGGSGGATAGGGAGGVGGSGTGGQTATGSADGAPCKQGSDCSSKHCSVDGVCCVSECSGPCQSCDGGKACVARPKGTLTPGCNGQHACDANGQCKTASGGSCLLGTDCASGFCAVGSVCCETECVGACSTCGGGQCSQVPEGQKGGTCDGPVDVCNAQGGCVTALGGSCGTPQDCLSGFCEPSYNQLACCFGPCQEACKGCDAQGSCSALFEGYVDPRCAVEAVCVGHSCQCAAGQCKRSKGEPCATDLQCASGTCILKRQVGGTCE
jgi:hypothetical protein